MKFECNAKKRLVALDDKMGLHPGRILKENVSVGGHKQALEVKCRMFRNPELTILQHTVATCPAHISHAAGPQILT